LTDLDLLRLLQLADSALPIGATAHSFGLETLTVEEVVGVPQLAAFVRDYLDEAGLLEAVACRTAFAGVDFAAVNERLSATKQARESRAASLALGRRFLRLAFDVSGDPRLDQSRPDHPSDIHSSAAFGLAGAVLGLDEDAVVAACLRQMVAAMVSAAQRLLPLGQTAASILLWELNADIAGVVERSRNVRLDDACCLTPMLDAASMRHPGLSTRLFIS
jgi:urease accessory protein